MERVKLINNNIKKKKQEAISLIYITIFFNYYL